MLRQTFGLKFNAARDYMSPGERTLFKEMRESGSITMFQMGACAECGADVPKVKKYCSYKCKEKANGTGEMD